MKKRSLFYILVSITLTGCNFNYSSSFSSSINSSQLIISSENSISSNPSLIDTELYSLTLNSSNFSNLGSYATNFDSKDVNDYTFGYYRSCKGSGDSFITLIPYSSYVDNNDKEGSIYNIDPIYGIRYISITYRTNLEDGNNPIIYFGEDFNKTNSIQLEKNSTSTTNTYCLYDANFFKIDCNSNRTFISNIEIQYTNIKNNYHSELVGSGYQDYRLNPTQYNGNLIDGVTSVNIPTNVEYTKDGYNILDTKEYTYYTFEYCKNHPEVISKASLVDPIDIASYYNTFRTHPANYTIKKQYDTYKEVFGNKTRCISTYSRKDGYANYVPWNSKPNSNVPLYHELDIDIDGTYNKNNRGSGRLVVWEYGFSSQGYDDSPVSIFTTDHYKSFQEYKNDGTFGKIFNGEMKITNYKFSPCMTKN